jgi:hypothetical protein
MSDHEIPDIQLLVSFLNRKRDSQYIELHDDKTRGSEPSNIGRILRRAEGRKPRPPRLDCVVC